MSKEDKKDVKKEEPKKAAPKPQAKELPSLYVKSPAAMLSNIVDAVVAITAAQDPDTFVFTPEGLYINAMDAGHYYMIILDVPNSEFQEYDCKEEFRLGLDLDDIKKLLKKTSNFATIDINKGEFNFILDRGGYTVEFKLHYFEAKAPMTTPQLTFAAKASIDPSLFKSILDDIAYVSDVIALKAEGKKLIMSGKGDKGSSEVPLGEGTMYPVDVFSKEVARSRYSTKYLTDVLKAVTALGTETIDLEFSSKMPLRITTRIGKAGKAEIYCSPRVDEQK